MKLWIVVLSIVLIIFFGWQLWHIFSIGTKEPAYKVVQKKDGYEIRKYDPYIIAHVSFSGSYSDVTNKGFKVLANYIFGGNKEAVRMPMTAPVFIEEKEKIDGFDISFVMPASFTKKTLPEPEDSQIKIKKEPYKMVAAYRFSWYATEELVEEKKKEFAALLKRDSVKQRSSMLLARYNPPFILPFFMRNELLVVVDA